MTKRKAFVKLHNDMGKACKFQVLHQYTGDSVEQSDFISLEHKEERRILTVHYHTGFLTTGRDNWIVSGIERREITSSLNLPPGLPPININGKMFVDMRWRSGHGFASDWKVHTLTSDDENHDLIITVHANIIEFVSKSGRSSSDWYPEYDILPHF